MYETNPIRKCEECNRYISIKVAEFSQSKYSKLLCFDCQPFNKNRKAKEEQKEMTHITFYKEVWKMSDITRLLLIIGSPRGIKSNSTAAGNYLVKSLKERNSGLEEETIVLTRTIRSEEKLEEMIDSIKKV